MIVDDEPDLLETMGMILELHGYHVVKVADGADAIACAVLEQPKLILLDVMLPHRTGWSLCRELLDNPRTASIPTVMVSARFQQEDVEKGLKAGAKDYLIKPFALEELLETVGRWVPKEAQPAV